MAKKTEEAALLAKTEGAPDNGRVLVMTDGEETLGYVVVALEDDTLVFYGFSVSGQTLALCVLRVSFFLCGGA